jgi:hypothetical protein
MRKIVSGCVSLFVCLYLCFFVSVSKVQDQKNLLFTKLDQRFSVDGCGCGVYGCA